MAKKKKNVLEYQEISDFFADMPLEEEQMEKVLEYLDQNNVDVLRITDDDDVDDEEIILTDEDVRIDTVVTHSAPSFCPPAAKRDLEHFCAGDEWLADDIRHERRDLERLYRWLTVHGHPLHTWYYGHYHASATTIHDGIIFHLLDVMEMKGI